MMLNQLRAQALRYHRFGAQQRPTPVNLLTMVTQRVMQKQAALHDSRQ
ncbi:hypothetical protein [Dickeya dianthicola]